MGGGGETQKYFSIDVPNDEYYGLIFTKNSTFDGNNNQTVDIMWDGYSNCYTLTSKNSSKKLIGEWSNYLQITESNSDGNIVSAVQEQLLEMGERKYEGIINNIAANTNYAEGFVDAIMSFKSVIESDN